MAHSIRLTRGLFDIAIRCLPQCIMPHKICSTGMYLLYPTFQLIIRLAIVRANKQKSQNTGAIHKKEKKVISLEQAQKTPKQFLNKPITTLHKKK